MRRSSNGELSQCATLTAYARLGTLLIVQCVKVHNG